MNWLLGIAGAVLGLIVAESRELLGAVAGFLLAFLLASSYRMRADVAAMARELALLKGRLAALSVEATRAAAASAPSAATPTAPAPSQVPRAPQAEVPPAGAAPAATPRAAAAPRPPATPRPAQPAEPGGFERLVDRIRAWFTEGNVPVKVGILVLLFGVAAALRLAAARGYFTLSVEARLAVIAGGAILALALGWRERLRRPAFGLSLQGGALGVLLLTVFAAYRQYGLLPAGLALALVVVLVGGSAALALLQGNMSLAVLGFLGGYLAPVLISTGSGDHVALFGYYAVLNAAVFAISWRRSWRLLNLIGFAFTFGVGTAWGSQHYRPEMFASVEAFLLLFFLSYLAIGLLYVLRQTGHRRPWLDGTLVFGTPLVAFPLQAALMRGDRMGLAFSALVVALVYAALVYWLRTRRQERLLTEAYGALALGFATMAVPLAFSASTTASVWALEGVGVAWIGLRQQRRLPWLAGLGLQVLAAIAFAVSQAGVPAAPASLLLLNPAWLGAAMLSFSGFALSLLHDRHRPSPLLPGLLFAWAVGWWLLAGLDQMELARHSLGSWRFATLYLAASIATSALLRESLRWSRAAAWTGICAALGLGLVFLADSEFGAPLAAVTLPAWALYLLAVAWALWSAAREAPARGAQFTHVLALWTVALAGSLQLLDAAARLQFGQGWQFLAAVLMPAAMSLLLWRRPSLAAWPLAGQFTAYRMGWYGLALPWLALAAATGLFLRGGAEPLAYLPLLNPLELGLVSLVLLISGLAAHLGLGASVRRAWPLVGFAFVTLATLRGVHHLHGEPWSIELLRSGFAQASLTVAWSLCGVAAWILGSRRADRRVWRAGAVLMAIVLAKLLLVDRGYMGNVPGIVSFMAVGLLLVGVGYVAPSPPKRVDQGEMT